MKKILCTIGFVLIIMCMEQATAQDPRIAKYDSLIQIAETDTGRIRLIVQKLVVLSSINIDSAINLALETLEEARKINYYRGEVDIMMNLLNNYSYKGNFKAAEQQIKQLEQIILPLNDSIDFAILYANKGMFYGMQSKYDLSINFYEKAIRITERSGRNKRLGVYYSNIAIGYQQQSNFPMALLYLQKALNLYEEMGNGESGQAYTLVNMANTYLNMGDFERAESTFMKSIEIAKRLQLNNVELYAYSNLASLYSDKERWQESYEYAIKAAELGDKMGDQGIEGASLSKASIALVNLGQPEKAIVLSQKAIARANASTVPLIIHQAYSSMGYALRAKGRWREAITFYEKGLEAIRDADIYTLFIGMSTRQLSESYEKTGEYAKALELFKMSTAISDSISRRENIRKATEQTMKFEFEKQALAARAIQDAKDEIMYTRLVALIIGLALSLVIIAGAFIAYFGKKKANVLLLNQKKEIEDTLLKLKNTQSQLIQSEKMASLGELTAGIAHEIQNPLNFVNNFAEVSNELIKEMKEEFQKGDLEEGFAIADDIEQNLEKINHHGKRAGDIVKGMLQHSRTSSGQKEPTDINALADEYLRLAYHGLRAKDKSFNADFKTEFDASLPKIIVNPQDIGRVLLNLINNAFYACAERGRSALNEKMNPVNKDPGGFENLQGLYKPTVTVSTKNLGDKIEIKVKDNGSGIPEEIKNKIFQPFFTTKPTGQGTGLGLSLSYDIITKSHGGELKVETIEKEETIFSIVLPI
ncbi:MAG: two-component sensor histidine kinase [Bacteroidetes bacterium]|nr:MAG: two-component sensor histidine kinase [Bacteroidota bacterium]